MQVTELFLPVPKYAGQIYCFVDGPLVVTYQAKELVSYRAGRQTLRGLVWQRLSFTEYAKPQSTIA